MKFLKKMKNEIGEGIIFLKKKNKKIKKNLKLKIELKLK